MITRGHFQRQVLIQRHLTFGRIKTASLIELEDNRIKEIRLKHWPHSLLENLLPHIDTKQIIWFFASQSLPTRCVRAWPREAPSWGRCLWLQARTPGRPCRRLSWRRPRHILPCLLATPPTAKSSERKTLHSMLPQWKTSDEAVPPFTAYLGTTFGILVLLKDTLN